MLVYLINPAVIYPVLCFPPQPISRQPKTIFTSHKQKRRNAILAPSAGLNCRGATSVTFGDLQNKINAKNIKLQSLSIPLCTAGGCSGEDAWAPLPVFGLTQRADGISSFLSALQLSASLYLYEVLT